VPILTGGSGIMPPANNPGTRTQIYATQGVPSDSNIGLPVASIVNGMLCQDVTTGHLYERRASVWTRADVVG
jgi:hypothetical protein